jgi:drug/metabolite transporter (DMT)-like permease
MTRWLRHRWAPEFVLIAATALWGAAFLVTHVAMARVPPLPFLALRFTVAAVAVRLLTGARVARITRAELLGGAAISVAMLAGYALQATALASLGSGRVAFICALYVPIVPLVQTALTRRLPRATTWLSVALAAAGMMLMAGGSGGGFGRGEAFALGAAFGVAAEILLMARFAPLVDPRRLAVVECACMAALALGLAGALGQRLPPLQPVWLACAIFLGAASALLQVSVNWAMRNVKATRATLIYATEPVWAAGFGLLAGERMGPSAALGAGLILCALLVNRPGNK